MIQRKTGRLKDFHCQTQYAKVPGCPLTSHHNLKNALLSMLTRDPREDTLHDWAVEMCTCPDCRGQGNTSAVWSYSFHDRCARNGFTGCSAELARPLLCNNCTFSVAAVAVTQKLTVCASMPVAALNKDFKDSNQILNSQLFYYCYYMNLCFCWACFFGSRSSGLCSWNFVALLVAHWHIMTVGAQRSEWTVRETTTTCKDCFVAVNSSSTVQHLFCLFSYSFIVILTSKSINTHHLPCDLVDVSVIKWTNSFTLCRCWK